MKEVYDILYSGVWHRALLSLRTNTAAHTRVWKPVYLTSDVEQLIQEASEKSTQ